MCFKIHKKFPFEQIATEPIIVFKTVMPPRYLRDPWIAHFEEQEKVWYSPVMEFRFREGAMFRSEIWGDQYFQKYCDPGTISYGFHSYASSVTAFLSRDLEHDLVIAEFVIPVGAKYYYNPSTNEYISEAIICIGYYPLWKSIVDSLLHPFTSFYKLLKHFQTWKKIQRTPSLTRL